MIKIRFFEEKESTRHHRLKFKVQFLIEVSHDDQQFFINNNNKKFTRNSTTRALFEFQKKNVTLHFFLKQITHLNVPAHHRHISQQPSQV
jgi:hypothetical protein